jgi:hypothetical protein
MNYRSNTELSVETLRRTVPSLFAETPHNSRSERYAYIPTVDVLHGLYNEGFRIFNASQSRTRIPGKADFTKHMLRLRHESHIGRAAVVGDSVPELVLINSHDGTSSFQLMGGMFRFVCCNGMVVPDTQCRGVKVQHSGDVIDKVKEGAFEVLDGLTRIVESRDDMRRIQLSEGEQLAFANAALQVRYDTEEKAAPIQARQLLQSRRWDDSGNDLWQTFNRVQENATKGGLSGRTATGQRRATRAVTGIDQDVKLNKALWTLAESMRALKSGE